MVIYLFIYFEYKPLRDKKEYQALLNILEGTEIHRGDRIQTGTDGSIYLPGLQIGRKSTFDQMVRIYYFAPKLFKHNATPKGIRLY